MNKILQEFTATKSLSLYDEIPMSPKTKRQRITTAVDCKLIKAMAKIVRYIDLEIKIFQISRLLTKNITIEQQILFQCLKTYVNIHATKIYKTEETISESSTGTQE